MLKKSKQKMSWMIPTRVNRTDYMLQYILWDSDAYRACLDNYNPNQSPWKHPVSSYNILPFNKTGLVHKILYPAAAKVTKGDLENIPATNSDVQPLPSQKKPNVPGNWSPVSSIEIIQNLSHIAVLDL